MGRYSSRSVSIDVDIDEFDDDTLVEEVVRRKLNAQHFEAVA